ncbi:MAG: type I restriction enzyme HsdR N-terminal domain-containing protein [Bacteroidales bacterium]|nr:type I restriction enzyme HsdR N-terminal domain-containing protein [Bacteroidales bacterium]MBO7233094.1 type I restriction enzyme HsdR N-terminal domain-containing protein [Bacteroidales bacterium]
MFRLNLPPYEYKIREVEQKKQIFDPFRRCFVALTPEEWVRQHFCQFLCQEKHFPAQRMANEYAIKLNGLSRRCDTVVFDKNLQVLCICEYKAPQVNITQEVFQQILRYNWVLKAKYLIVSNGLKHYACRIDYEKQQTIFLQDIPDFSEL